MANQTITKSKRKPNKTKPIPPPEDYIVPRLTHINLNDKLEYNRSTIPFPDDKPPSEDVKKSESKIRSQIEQLRINYLREKAEAKAKAEAELGQKPKTWTKTKPKSKQVPKDGPNPLIMVMNEDIDFDRAMKMRECKITELFARQDLEFDIEWRHLNMINNITDTTRNDLSTELKQVNETNMDTLNMNNDMNIENGHDLELDTEWKRLNKINMANMDTDNELNTSGTLGIEVLKMKIDMDTEIES